MTTAADVLAGNATWGVDCSDCLDWLRSLPDDSVDLLFTSPPYEVARTYGIGEKMVCGQAWVDWMVEVVRAAAPKVKGLIAINCEGQTRDYQYTGTPYLLFADLLRADFNMRRPVFFHRVGIPGSGGPDWLRADVEPVVCVTRPGKLPWSDNTACGHPPKWAPGGEMSNRLTSGQRVNQWGMRVKADGSLTATDPTQGDGLVALATKPSHRVVEVGGAPDDTPALFDDGDRSQLAPVKNAHGVNRAGCRPGSRRGKDDHKAKEEKPAHAQRKAMKIAAGGKRHTKRDASPQPDGSATREQVYLPPVLANPGTLIQQTYTADEVAALLAQAGEVFHCTVGGGQMGHDLAHENEAPFPLALAEFFVRSFCPPGGVVCDPFAGSGTTLHAAVANGRRGIGCDVRESQVTLIGRRMATVTPSLPGAA